MVNCRNLYDVIVCLSSFLLLASTICGVHVLALFTSVHFIIALELAMDCCRWKSSDRHRDACLVDYYYDGYGYSYYDDGSYNYNYGARMRRPSNGDEYDVGYYDDSGYEDIVSANLAADAETSLDVRENFADVWLWSELVAGYAAAAPCVYTAPYACTDRYTCSQAVDRFLHVRVHCIAVRSMAVCGWVVALRGVCAAVCSHYQRRD